MSQTDPRPIFIVGPSRSGTTMLGTALSLHPDVFISSETHYFDDLRVRLAGYERRPLSPEQARACEDYFMKLTYGVYGTASAARWTHDHGNKRRRVERDALRAMAAELGDGTDAWFEAACRVQSPGRSRWGEKTPRHVFRIADILERYPQAQVIAMVRDPRAVVASYRGFSHKSPRDDQQWQQEDNRRIQQSYHPLIIALLWNAAVKAALRAQRTFGPDHVHVQRYEDLVTEPEAAMARLARWLGIEYHPLMITGVPQMNSSFAADGPMGVSREPIDRWRQSLDARELAAVQWCCSRMMAELGYEPISHDAPPTAVAAAWTSLPVAATRAFVANRYRIADGLGYCWRRLSFALSSAG